MAVPRLSPMQRRVMLKFLPQEPLEKLLHLLICYGRETGRQ